MNSNEVYKSITSCYNIYNPYKWPKINKWVSAWYYNPLIIGAPKLTPPGKLPSGWFPRPGRFHPTLTNQRRASDLRGTAEGC